MLVSKSLPLAQIPRSRGLGKTLGKTYKNTPINPQIKLISIKSDDELEEKIF
jgi:hypothetical protein